MLLSFLKENETIEVKQNKSWNNSLNLRRCHFNPKTRIKLPRKCHSIHNIVESGFIQLFSSFYTILAFVLLSFLGSFLLFKAFGNINVVFNNISSMILFSFINISGGNTDQWETPFFSYKMTKNKLHFSYKDYKKCLLCICFAVFYSGFVNIDFKFQSNFVAFHVLMIPIRFILFCFRLFFFLFSLLSPFRHLF